MNTNLAYDYGWEDERPYEVWNGEVYDMASPSYEHNQAKAAIITIFHNYLNGKRCRVLPDPTDVRFEDEDTTVVPDVTILCDMSKMDFKGRVIGAPDLIVEVQSPSTGKHDRTRKMKLYERHGVKEYWIVTPKEKTIEQYILEDGKYTLAGFYVAMKDWELESLSERKRADFSPTFKTSVFDDLVVDVYDVFRALE